MMEWYRFVYYHAMGGRNYKGEHMECPGAHPEFLSESIRYKTEIEKDWVKRSIVRHLDPGLFAIEETDANLQGDWGRALSSKLFRRTVADYENSWYGKRVRVRPSRTIGFNEWWRRWSIASFCQHLVDTGYKLVMR
jgi:hypothetical protein